METAIAIYGAEHWFSSTYIYVIVAGTSN